MRDSALPNIGKLQTKVMTEEFIKKIDGYWYSEDRAPYQINDGVNVILDIGTKSKWSTVRLEINDVVVAYYVLQYDSMQLLDDEQSIRVYFKLMNKEEVSEVIDEIFIECKPIFLNSPMEMLCKISIDEHRRIFKKAPDL